MDFAVHAARLSAEADTRLGDSLLYAVQGAEGGAYATMKGRITGTEADPGFGKIDEQRGHWRLRIAKVLVPTPSLRDRVQCAAILGEGNVYRPMSKDPIDDGRYWLVDLQRV